MNSPRLMCNCVWIYKKYNKVVKDCTWLYETTSKDGNHCDLCGYIAFKEYGNGKRAAPTKKPNYSCHKEPKTVRATVSDWHRNDGSDS